MGQMLFPSSNQQSQHTILVHNENFLNFKSQFRYHYTVFCENNINTENLAYLGMAVPNSIRVRVMARVSVRVIGLGLGLGLSL